MTHHISLLEKKKRERERKISTGQFLLSYYKSLPKSALYVLFFIYTVAYHV